MNMNSAKPSKTTSHEMINEIELLYENAPCGYHSLDEKGKIIRVNNTELTMLGYSRQEMIGQPLTKFLTPNSIKFFKKNFPLVKKGKVINDQEIEYIAKDGSVFYMSITVKPMLEPSGKFVASHTALININDRKKLERERQSTELALKITKTAIWDWDIISNNSYWNEIYNLLLGYQPYEQTPSYELWKNRVYSEDLPEVEDKLSQALLNHSDYEVEYRVIWEDGTVHWLLDKGYGLYDESGQAVRMIGTTCEITERKLGEIYKSDEQQKLSLFIKYVPVCVAMFDQNMNYLEVSQRWLEICHLKSREEVIGRSHYEVLDIPEYWRNFHQQGLKGIASKCEEDFFILPDGSKQWLKWELQPWHFHNGEVGGILMFVEDITQSHQAKIALEEKKEQLRMALTGAKAGVWSWDPISGDLFWSPEMFELYGFKASDQQPSYESWYQTILHPEDRHWVNSSIKKQIEQGQKDFQLEYRIIHPQKGIRWFLSVGNMTINDQGEVVNLSGINIDISDRKLVEIALEEKLQKEKLVDHIAESISQTFNLEEVLQPTLNQVRELLKVDRVIVFRFESDWSGTVIAESVANDYPAILGTNIDDPCFRETYIEPYLQGQTTQKVDFSAENIEPCYRELMQSFEVKANLVIPILQNNHLWGLLITHQCSAPRQWQETEIELMQQLSTQITIAINQAELFKKNQEELFKRQKVQEALLASEEKLQAIIDYAPAGIYVIDLENKHLLVNSFYTKLLSATKEQLLGKSITEVWDTKTAENFILNNQKVIKTKKVLKTEEIVPQKDGNHTYITLKFPLYDLEGNVYAVCGISTDITDRKQLERQFYQAQRLESLGTLASGIAHDLNNVFTPILAITQLLPLKLKKMNLDQKTMRLLDIAEESVKRGANLVKQILAFARGGQGDKNTLEIQILLKEIVKISQQTLPKSVSISLEIPENSQFLVKADQTQLDQVLMNLLINARDAMPQGGKINVSLQKHLIDSIYLAMNTEPIIGNCEEGNYIIITVNDTGEGIPAHIIDQIFEPFFTTKEIGKGTGLGLATVLGIIQDHGGFLQVFSDVGKGATFKIYLPEVEEKEMLAQDEEMIKISLQGKGETILVVDDEPLIREMTKITLDNHNYQTMMANDGMEAIAVYVQSQQQISLILMNMIMPNIDGLTTINTLLKINPALKIIACSGLESQRKSALEAGAKAFLIKPYTTEDLLQNIYDLLI